MNYYNLDLHIHSVLSPCADLLMTPGNIVSEALRRGLDIIALTDHNSAENVKIILKMAENTPLKVIPGMEVETREEVHLLCYFGEPGPLMDWQEVVYNNLPDLKNDEEYFGYQIKTDKEDRYESKVERLLAAAVDLSISEVVEGVKKRGGVVIPSHIDKANSIITNLGFIPPDLDLPILEISSYGDLSSLQKKFDFLDDYYFICNSDSHYLKDIKPMMKMKLKAPQLKAVYETILKNEAIII